MKRIVERTIYNNVIVSESTIEKEDAEAIKIFNDLMESYLVSDVVNDLESKHFTVEIDWNNALEVRLEDIYDQKVYCNRL